MENVQPGDTEPATGPAVAIEQMPEDPYPSGMIFQIWSLFVRAIIYGAGLGVLGVAVVTATDIVLSGRTQGLLAAPAIMFFAGLVGAIVGAVGAMGALIAVLIFAPFSPSAKRAPAHPTSREGRQDALPEAREEHFGTPHLRSGMPRSQTQRRALIAGVGAAVLVCAGWIVFVAFIRSDYGPVLTLVPAVIGGAAAGGLAWLSVRRWERAQSSAPVTTAR